MRREKEKRGRVQVRVSSGREEESSREVGEAISIFFPVFVCLMHEA